MWTDLHDLKIEERAGKAIRESANEIKNSESNCLVENSDYPRLGRLRTCCHLSTEFLFSIPLKDYRN